MALIGSMLPIRMLLALTQRGPEGASLRELARATQVRDSSAQHALATLIEDGSARASGTRHDRRYHLIEGELAGDLLRLARHYQTPEEALGTLVRANPGVEFATYDASERELIVVYANDAGDADEARLQRTVGQVSAPPIVLRDARHDQMVEAILQDPGARERALAGAILKGRPERSLPDRSRQGDLEHARRLGRPHPDLRLPSRRRLAALAHRYGLVHLGLFGSAVRADFRPDSDVDVLVRYRPGTRKRLADVLGLERELELLLDRDVDLVEESALGEPLRRRALEEEVELALTA